MLDDATSSGTPPAQTDKTPKPFRISTVFGPGAGQDETDPLLLAQISGTEAVSAPYVFDLTILQRTTNDDGSPRDKIEPAKLINTVASFGMSEGENDGQFFNWHDRHGVIDRFEEVGRNPFPEFRCYTARFVPALKLLERERTFRIFENIDALAAIRSVLQAQGEIPSDYLIVNLSTPLPKLPYIVQFGEDSLSFVHRLLAMHGIWYHFIHELGRKTEQMVLGEGKKQHPTTSARGLFTADAPDRFLVAGYRRVFAPGPRRILLGEFNPLQPKSPFQGRADIDKSYDIATADVVHDPGRAQQRIFPATFQGNEELKGMAKQQMGAAETQIILATGQTKNRSLRAGEGARVFLKHGDRAENCLVTTLSLHGLDATAGRAVNGFAGFMSLVWKGVNPFSDGKLTDISAAIAQTEMGAFLRDTASTVGSVAGVVSTVTSVFSPISAIIALPDLISKAADKLGPTAAAVTPVTDASTKFLASSQIDFGNSFIGVSQIDDTDSFLLPPPVAVRQTARGPHVAVVIGPHGATPSGDDLWADALGRVRVRFPWEPPDESGDPLAQPPFDDSQRSAWLRVSEGWAGRGFGTQFLPRIGQEVLVDFVDGDPERPIIVGRLYNGEGGSGAAALPFPSTKASSTNFDTLSKLPDTVSPQWPMSGIRTFSTPRPSDNAEKRFNVLRFDDSWQKEQVVIRSQGRLDETSFASTFQTSHADRHVQIGGKDAKTGESGGSLFTTMGGEDNLHVTKSRYTGIDINEEQSIKGHLFLDVTGAVKIISQAEINLSAPKIVLEASSKISLKVGSSFVVIDPSGVFINGAQVLINSGGSALSVADADMTDPIDAGSADPGDPINWRELHKGGGGGGGHHHHTAKASHGLNVTRNKAGSFQVTKGIKVKGSPDYVSAVVQDLTMINSTPDGHARLDRIDNSGKQTTIQNYDAAHPKPASPNADTIPGNGAISDFADAGGKGKIAAIDNKNNTLATGNGKGSDSNIHYDPADWPDPTSRTKAPGDVILNHELGHADHQGHGQEDFTPNNTDSYGNNEEFNNLPSDNAYRSQRNPDPSFQRKDYGDF
jgi:uncharacterized protein involved in type VI secretion and phage assembly